MHSKGVSPVVSATLILLVSILLMTVVYVWAQATISDFTAQLSEETEQQALNLASELTIHPTNTAVVTGQTYYVFIDNSGSTTLHNVSLFFGGAQVGVDTSLTGVASTLSGVTYYDPETGSTVGPGSSITEFPQDGIAYFTLQPAAGVTDFSGISVLVSSDETSAVYNYP